MYILTKMIEMTTFVINYNQKCYRFNMNKIIYYIGIFEETLT